MSFNYKLAKEIYGMNPWFVDEKSIPTLLGILKNASSGINLEISGEKCNAVSVCLKSDTFLINDYESWKLRRVDAKDEVVAIVNLDGPITKNGGASSYGMLDLSSIMMSMSRDERVKGFIILADSGGGSSNAVEIMVDTINEVKKSKPVYSLISKGGMAASAAYGILSATSKIYAESKMSIVGSAGTMIEFQGKPANSTDPDGTKNIRLYASKSTLKNKAFEEAVNNDNYDLLINDLLDPINENFLKMIEKNRPSLKGTDFSTGKTVFAKDAVGSYIDGIESFDSVVKMVLKEFKSYVQKSNNINQNSNPMTAEELKSQHPATYNSIFNAGVAAGKAEEKDRCGAWMAHASTDIESVKKGIDSGENISQTQSQEFLVKAVSKQTAAKVEKDSPEAVNTPESGSKTEPTEAEKFYGQISKDL